MGYPESFNELEQWRDELRRSLSREGIMRAIEARIAEESDPDRLEILDHLLVQEHMACGNRAEADAIRARRPDLEILRWRDDWRETHIEGHVEGDIVPVLEQKIRDETGPRRLQTLRWLLAQEQRDRGNYLAAEAVQRADADANPDSARPLIALASQKLYDENLPDEAMHIIERAIAAAMRSGLFRREALGVKARIALELADYRAVEDSLRQIMALTMTRGHVDIGAERDFFDRLPPGSIDPEVARAYDEYCRARGRRRTASAEQIDAFVLAAARPEWLKVARIIADVLKACERGDVASRDHTIATRIEALVAAGRFGRAGRCREVALQRGAARRACRAGERRRAGCAAARGRDYGARRFSDRRGPHSHAEGRPPRRRGAGHDLRAGEQGRSLALRFHHRLARRGTARAGQRHRFRAGAPDGAEVRRHRAVHEQGAQGRQAEMPGATCGVRVSAGVERARARRGRRPVFVDRPNLADHCAPQCPPPTQRWSSTLRK
ncbi:MAG TPA: DUF3658 domain-containing protein [Xanthobacteraceae bacterium]|nr:DUF3658 domain-containing protein [Xanthobacteraceae bacterium]